MGGPLVVGMLGPGLDSARPPAAPPATPATPSLMRVKAAAQVEDQVRPRVQRSRVDVHGRGLLPGPCIRPDGRWLSRPAPRCEEPRALASPGLLNLSVRSACQRARSW
jgi:hypothetical protein